MRNLHIRFPGGKAKCLTLSYDDAVQQDMRLCELMKAHGIAGTFNINTGSYAEEGKTFKPGTDHRRMTKAQCTETYADPLFEVATHGLTHPFLPDIPLPLAVQEIMEDRRNIEAQYGGICRGHAYPYGPTNDDVVTALKCCGIAYARTTYATHSFEIPKDWLRLDPTCHHKDKMLPELTERFINDTPKRAPYFFYLWGHTYEFESDDNWSVIETFFDKVSGRDDVWYATNIQAYDYISAYKQLIFSADGLTVYNPTVTDLWVSKDDGKNIIGLPAGETVKL